MCDEGSGNRVAAQLQRHVARVRRVYANRREILANSLRRVFGDGVEFTLPPCYEAEGWKRLFDTADPQSDASQLGIGAAYKVTARSMLLFERVPERMDRQPAS